uniref:Deoxyribonuclease-2-alpha n=1 Tax=Sander lucioperca TaxID=283035 RepID=A0A8D0A2Q7_SANLU
ARPLTQTAPVELLSGSRSDCGSTGQYIIYKVPIVTGKTEGLEYIYIDPAGKKTSRDHNKPINHPDGVLANTLEPIFNPNTSMVRIMFKLHDQPPGCQADNTFGHSKGLVMMDKTTTGVWLLHSTPRFPFKRDNNFYPSSGAKNAQTFICVTFNYDQFKDIGNGISYIFIFMFLLVDLNMMLIHFIFTFCFILFCSYFIFFYGDLYLTIAETYKTDVRVQTWGCQKGRDGSYCVQNRHQVIKIASVKANLGNGKVEWKTTTDLSKWCVSIDNNNHLICIADVNRATSQYKRPGGGLGCHGAWFCQVNGKMRRSEIPGQIPLIRNL